MHCFRGMGMTVSGDCLPRPHPEDNRKNDGQQDILKHVKDVHVIFVSFKWDTILVRRSLGYYDIG